MFTQQHSLETAFAKPRVATVETVAHLKAEAINQTTPQTRYDQPASGALPTRIPVQFSESAFVPTIHFRKQSD
jgi:hypothetical protein